jgi:hypothetical protein
MTSEEGYPPDWKHCTVHADDKGQVHIDGDEELRYRLFRALEKPEDSSRPFNGPPPNTIDREEMQKIISVLRAQCDRVMWSKMDDYTLGDKDQLHNFYSAAAFLGKDVRQVWATYFYKQIAAVMSWAKTGKVESEGLLSRMVDICNYAALGLAIAQAEGDICLIQNDGTTEFDLERFRLRPEQAKILKSLPPTRRKSRQ